MVVIGSHFHKHDVCEVYRIFVHPSWLLAKALCIVILGLISHPVVGLGQNSETSENNISAIFSSLQITIFAFGIPSPSRLSEFSLGESFRKQAVVISQYSRDIHGQPFCRH